MKDYNFCGSCQAPATKLCSGCKVPVYCDAICQKSHWPTHKSDCKLLKRYPPVEPRMREYFLSFYTDFLSKGPPGPVYSTGWAIVRRQQQGENCPGGHPPKKNLHEDLSKEMALMKMVDAYRYMCGWGLRQKTVTPGQKVFYTPDDQKFRTLFLEPLLWLPPTARARLLPSFYPPLNHGADAYLAYEHFDKFAFFSESGATLYLPILDGEFASLQKFGQVEDLEEIRKGVMEGMAEMFRRRPSRAGMYHGVEEIDLEDFLEGEELERVRREAGPLMMIGVRGFTWDEEDGVA